MNYSKNTSENISLSLVMFDFFSSYFYFGVFLMTDLYFEGMHPVFECNSVDIIVDIIMHYARGKLVFVFWV